MEANDSTIPGGQYRLDITTCDERVTSTNRASVKIQADASVQQADGTWRRKGKVFFNVSPQGVRDKYDRLDTPSRLWADLARIVGNNATNGQVLDYLKTYPSL